MKATSLASTKTLMDMTGIARTIVAQTFAPYEIFKWLAIIYMILTFITKKTFGRIEKRMREMIADAFPEHGVLSEEFPNTNLDAEFVWVLTPIDGIPVYGTLDCSGQVIAAGDQACLNAALAVLFAANGE